MDAPAQYLEELRSELALYPTWFPFDRIEVGTFGTIKRGQFVADGTLKELGIELVRDSQRTNGNLKKSRGIKFKAASSTQATAGLVDLSLGVEFHVERAHAWAFAARGVDAVRIANQVEVQREVLEAFKRGDWKREWLLVSELRRAEVLNVLITRSKNVGGRVVAKGTLAVADVLLGEDASFEIAGDDAFTVENHKGGTPLYGLRKLVGFLRPGFESISGGGADDAGPALEVADDESFDLA